MSMIEDAVLTPEQQELVSKNHKLIYWYLCKHHLDIQEYYDILAIALCKAAAVYDPSDGSKFSTLAACCMAHDVQMHWRHMTCHSVIPESNIISFDAPVKGRDGDECSSLDIILKDFEAVSTIDETEAEVLVFLQQLRPRHQKILLYLLNDYKVTEIADMMGCAKSTVSRIKKSIARKWINFMS